MILQWLSNLSFILHFKIVWRVWRHLIYSNDMRSMWPVLHFANPLFLSTFSCVCYIMQSLLCVPMVMTWALHCSCTSNCVFLKSDHHACAVKFACRENKNRGSDHDLLIFRKKLKWISLLKKYLVVKWEEDLMKYKRSAWSLV